MSFNLISKLTEEDKTKISNYIYTFGVTEDRFIGLDEWLKYWGHSKVKLYKLLGNQMIHSEPYTYEKNEDELKKQLDSLIDDSELYSEIMTWVRKNQSFITDNEEDVGYTETKIRMFIGATIFSPITLLDDKIDENFKIKFPSNKRTFQVQKGAKPVRTVGKLITYCLETFGESEESKKVQESFEDFRLKHSMILNDKKVTGEICVSIHPLDFMSMSDNSLNWSSCMSWKGSGCYNVGSVEMMNSNNVLCCYFKAKEDFYFGEEYEKQRMTSLSDEQKPMWTWSNKKYRQLLYATKDIIVNGKSYPYHNDTLSLRFIEVVRELARKNLNWGYTFGPERYLDMKHISGLYSMERAKDFIAEGNTTKHNIIFESKGMYNDMVNDKKFHYWCIRNKVKKNKVITYSGKSSCLCCGHPTIFEYDDYDTADDDLDAYNDRYSNTEGLVCEDCKEENGCDLCGSNNLRTKMYLVKNEKGDDIRLCTRCVNRYVRKCPDCDQPFIVTTWISDGKEFSQGSGQQHTDAYIKIQECETTDELGAVVQNDLDDLERCTDPYYYDEERLDRRMEYIYPVCGCNSCMSKKTGIFEKKTAKIGPYWRSYCKTYYRSKEIEDKEKWQLYFPFNLRKVEEIHNGDLIKC